VQVGVALVALLLVVVEQAVAVLVQMALEQLRVLQTLAVVVVRRVHRVHQTEHLAVLES